MRQCSKFSNKRIDKLFALLATTAWATTAWATTAWATTAWVTTAWATTRDCPYK